RHRRQWDRVEPAVPAGSNPAGQSYFIPSTCLRPDPAPPVGAADRSDAGPVIGGVLDGGLNVLEEFVDDGDAVGDASLRAGEVDDEGPSAHPGDPTAHYRRAGRFQALAPHRIDQSRRLALEQFGRELRGAVIR